MADPELVKLQRKWYAILKKHGFQDIERFNRYGAFDDLFNKHTSTRKGMEACAEDAEYYRAARHFFWEYKFRNAREKRVWELHCEGVSYRDIMKSLRQKPHQRLRPISFREVFQIVNRLKDKMREELLYGEG
jgi:hypothetical protein